MHTLCEGDPDTPEDGARYGEARLRRHPSMNVVTLHQTTTASPKNVPPTTTTTTTNDTPPNVLGTR